MRPILSPGQWERVLLAEDIPDLEPDEATALMLHQLGVFSWSDVNEHRRLASVMVAGEKEVKNSLIGLNPKTNRDKFFMMSQRLSNLRSHIEWHTSMADRIAQFLCPVEVMKKVKKERERESSGVEGADREDGAEHREGDRGTEGLEGNTTAKLRG